MSVEPRTVALDASVVLKWQLRDERYTAQADALLLHLEANGALRAIAPYLLLYEVVNGVVSAVRQRRLDSLDAAQALAKLADVDIELKEVAPQQVLELALRHGLSAYDAAYLALAQAEGCELWTGDKPFYDAIKGAAPLVRWIGEYPVPG